jgi:hypothetical protein
MEGPFWSQLTLFTELGITACVYFIIWRGYARNQFMSSFAFGVLLYELLFNVSNMSSRELHSLATPALSPYLTALAIYHGIFSLVMFIALVAFFIAGWRGYGAGVNFFALHVRLTVSFLIAWTISILSGVALFVSLYLS